MFSGEPHLVDPASVIYHCLIEIGWPTVQINSKKAFAEDYNFGSGDFVISQRFSNDFF